MSESLRDDLQRRGAKVGVTCLCPTLINTGIYNAFRNRPPELLDADALPSGEELERLRTSTARGIPPEDVAELVLRAVQDNEFYALTNRSIDDRVRQRMEAILNRRDLSALVR
jgi:NAD(P)-dependent dehydrogenase (short-subunit alcohol dehydrogenase family)